MLWRFLCLSILLQSVDISAQEVQNGVLDLTEFSFDAKPTIPLKGEWAFYPSQFISPASKQPATEKVLINIPDRWEQSGLPAMGYGSYQLFIIRNSKEPLALRIPDLFSTYKLFVNNEKLASMGVPGVDSDSEKPGRNYQLVSLAHIPSDTLNVVIHISNFVHSKGGIGSPITLGTLNSLTYKKFINDVYDVFMAGCLVMGAFFFLGLYFYGRKEKMALYFALFCLVYSYRIVGWGNYVLHDIIDIPYRFGMTIEYSTFYLTAFFFCLYLKHLFSEETPKKLVNFFLSISLLWALMTLLPVRIFSQLNDPFLIVLLLGMVLISFVYTKALIRGKEGAKYSIYSTVGILLVFFMKTAAYLNIIEEILWVSMLGQLVFILFQSLILSRHFTASWRSAKELAEGAAKTKSDFLSVMSHEIRTPLNSVIGTTYHLMDTNPREDQIPELKNLKNASNHLLTLIDNVLDYSKIDAGKLELEESDIVLKDYCESIVNVFKTVASKKGISMIFEYDENLPKVVVLDKTRVRQILTNLIGNAIKFTEKGYVKFCVNKGPEKDDKVEVLFKVEDTGIGVSNDLKDRIFKSFQQASSSVTRKYGGTGLGLSITKQLVEQMDSKIYLQSEPGHGSIFFFSLVLKIGHLKEISIKEDTKQSLTGHSVLLVEDNSMNVLIAKRLLEKWGIKVDLAGNGQEAVELMHEKGNEFDLILMDLQMPIMDGYQATKTLRGLGYNLPIIAVTASALYDKSKKKKDSGLSDIVTKPFNPDDLYSAIFEQLNNPA
ncbi:response regulator [Ekhidna sp.]